MRTVNCINHNRLAEISPKEVSFLWLKCLILSVHSLMRSRNHKNHTSHHLLPKILSLNYSSSLKINLLMKCLVWRKCLLKISINPKLSHPHKKKKIKILSMNIDKKIKLKAFPKNRLKQKLTNHPKHHLQKKTQLNPNQSIRLLNQLNQQKSK
jgi:hypothetical protein